MLIHYNPDEIKFNDLKNEMKSLIKSLGPTDDIEINSRIFSFPTVYLDKWTKECIDDYSSKIAQKTPDPEFIVELNNLENTDQFVRVLRATESGIWIFWPGLPFMMPLDPRCKLTAPKYNPPRTWTPKGAVGMGGSARASTQTDYLEVIKFLVLYQFLFGIHKKVFQYLKKVYVFLNQEIE